MLIVLRKVASDGHRVSPNCWRRSGSVSAAHSAIAAYDQAPASVAAIPAAKNPPRWWRTPRRARGAGTRENNSSSTTGPGTDTTSALVQAGIAGVRKDGIGGCGLGVTGLV